MKKTSRIIACILMIAMVASLLPGFSGLFSRSTEEIYAASGDVCNSDGIYKTISKTGTLGSDSNPFVVLEIVPSMQQANFGYLVGGQEPINVGAFSELSKAKYEERNPMAVDLEDYFKYLEDSDDVVTEQFSADIEEYPDYTYYKWVPQVDHDRYGKYTLNRLGTGTYDIKKEYEDYKECAKDEGPYIYVRKYVKPGEYGVTAADCDTVFLVPCAEGEGTYSSGATRYKKVFAKDEANETTDKASEFYSRKYKLATGAGNKDIQFPYEYYYTNTDVNGKDNEQNWSINDYTVYFKKATSADAGKTRYSVKGYTSGSPWYNRTLLIFYDYYSKKYRKDSGYYKTGGSSYIVTFEKDPAGEYVVDGSPSATNSRTSKADAPYTYDLEKSADPLMIGKTNGNYLSGSYSMPESTGKAVYDAEGNRYYAVGAYTKTEDPKETDPTTGLTKVSIINEKGFDGLSVGDSAVFPRKDYASWTPTAAYSNPYDEYLAYQEKIHGGRTFTAGEEPREVIMKNVGLGKGDYKLYSGYEENPSSDEQHYKKIYKMKWVANTSGSGDYDLVKFNYPDGREAEAKAEEDGKETDPSLFIISEQEYKEGIRDGFDSEYVFKVGREPVSAAYRASVTNTELFKMYGLGLTYKDGDPAKQDTLSYTFDGWYYEPECINKFYTSDRIYDNIKVYAKWNRTYAGLQAKQDFRFEFNRNYTPAEGAGGEGTGAEDSTKDEAGKITYPSLEGIPKGNKAVKIKSTPVRKGYVFTGWYTDKAASHLYDFNTPVTSDTVVYAGWRRLVDASGENYEEGTRSYTIIYDDGVLPEEAGQISELPGPVSDVLENGMIGNLKDEEFRQIPEKKPKRTGYTFTGWYWDRECSIPFVYDDPINADESISEIILYAGWKKTADVGKLTVTFDVNKPADAIETPQIREKTLGNIEYGSIPEYEASRFRPSLTGNIQNKLDNYHVKVITITPEYINKSENLHLIDRANMIVISDAYDSDAASYFNTNKNRTQFPLGSYDKNKKTFSGDNDLNGNVVLKLFARIVGTSSVDPCPVIYDYSIYDSLKDTAGNITFTSTFSDGAAVNIPAVPSTENNVAKLYMLTQQASPVTLYNAYVRDSSKLSASGKNLKMNGETKWCDYTLVPFDVISKEEWNEDRNGALETIGFTADIDRDDYLYSLIKNRLLIFNSTYGTETNKTVAELFTAESAFLNDDNPGLLEKFGRLGETNGSVKAHSKLHQGILYMLSNPEEFRKYDKKINILEIEPCDSKKGEKYWFWYLSRYVPNFDSAYSVDIMSSSEFIGSLKDLSSNYDVIYIGVDKSAEDTSVMPTTPETMTVRSSDPKNNEPSYTIQKDQYINKPYYTKEHYDTEQCLDISKTEKTELEGYRKVSAHRIPLKPYIDLYRTGLITFDYNLGLEVDHSKTEAFNLYDKYLNIVSEAGNGEIHMLEWNSLEYRYIWGDWSSVLRGNWIIDVLDTIGITLNVLMFPSIKVEGEYIYNSDVIIGSAFRAGAGTSGNLVGRKKAYNDYQEGDFYLDDYWINVQQGDYYRYHANGNVVKGEKVWFVEDTEVQIPYDTYAYAHTGKLRQITGTHKGIAWGIFDEEGSGDNRIDEVVASGNDITKAKYDELINYVSAGYPVIVSSRCFAGGGFDTSVIDPTSYIYDFLTELKTRHPDSFFPEYLSGYDFDHDEKFIDALNRKDVSIRMTAWPSEYTGPGSHYINTYTDSDGNLQFMESSVLSYRFLLDGPSTGTYTVSLYADTNADGKFEDEEKLDTLDVQDKTINRTRKPNELTPGHDYTVSRRVDDYAGALPWKLVVTHSAGAYTSSAEATGICAIKVNVEEKKKINVVQIVPDESSNVYFATTDEISEAIAKHGGVDISDSNVSTFYSEVVPGSNNNTGRFDLWTKDLNDFYVEFFRLTISEFKEICTPGAESHKKNHVIIDGNKIKCESKTNMANRAAAGGEVLREVDDVTMLILGFADNYQDISDSESLKQIKEFINQGKAVLFTHDTTSARNYRYSSEYGGIADTGYNLTKSFRELLGMDRYGIMDHRGKASVVLNDFAKSYAERTYHDFPEMANAPGSLYTASTQWEGISRILTQGYTNMAAQGLTYSTADTGTITASTKATKCNTGQITNYPYVIGDDITVASTHSQWYQLDMEDNSITVWYCLDGNKNTTVYKTRNDVRNNYYIYSHGNITYSGVGHSASLSNDEVKLFINTIVASYRAITLASKPIITNRDKSTENDTDYLYVDYDMSLIDTSDGTIRESEAFGEDVGKHTYEVWNPEDGYSSKIEKEFSTKRVYFKIRNYSIVRDKEMVIRYYPKKTGTVGPGEEPIYREFQMILPTYISEDTNGVHSTGDRVSEKTIKFCYNDYSEDLNNPTVRRDSATGAKVDSGIEYYVDVPIENSYYEYMSKGTLLNYALDRQNDFSIQLEVYLGYGHMTDALKAEKGFDSSDDVFENEPRAGYRNVVFMRRGMFNLD